MSADDTSCRLYVYAGWNVHIYIHVGVTRWCAAKDAMLYCKACQTFRTSHLSLPLANQLSPLPIELLSLYRSATVASKPLYCKAFRASHLANQPSPLPIKLPSLPFHR